MSPERCPFGFLFVCLPGAPGSSAAPLLHFPLRAACSARLPATLGLFHPRHNKTSKVKLTRSLKPSLHLIRSLSIVLCSLAQMGGSSRRGGKLGCRHAGRKNSAEGSMADPGGKGPRRAGFAFFSAYVQGWPAQAPRIRWLEGNVDSGPQNAPLDNPPTLPLHSLLLWFCKFHSLRRSYS